MEKIKKRSEVEEKLKWNINALYNTEKDYEDDLNKLVNLSKDFKKKYENNLKDEKTILEAMKVYEEIQILIDYTINYVSLTQSVDMTDDESNRRSGKFDMIISEVFGDLSFFESELSALDVSLLEKCRDGNPYFKSYFEDLILEKPHILSKEVEETLSKLNLVLEAPLTGYDNTKLVDMSFEDFEIDGKNYEMSFVKFENEYQLEPNTKVRRKAYENFAQTLDKYKHTVATYYNTQVQKEKILSKMRGYDSIFDYLLFKQKVTREMYDRQIDLIMKHLAPVMRKYAQLIKKEHNLDKLTFADLKLPLYSDYAPTITIDEAKKYVLGALAKLGDEYLSIAEKYDEERWVDFAQNIGKSTGGFCASPYKKQPFILLSWSGLLSEVFTLVHEIGHGVHFRLSQQQNSTFSQEPSLYLVEAPSTLNEMLLTGYLIEESKDEKFKKWALSCMIENTYYHNFVTHLLEADYQRKVYKLVDSGESVNAYMLCDLMEETYRDFFGEDIDLTGAKYTWMRQPHYYDGLYSYTYSAGLVVSTVVSQNILSGKQEYAKNWIEFLKSGGEKNPVELCKVAGVDITTDSALLETIEFISKTVDEIAS
ncbi:oligoendopeptidase F [Peptostreptococcaceae bacterium AS15]|nr:oligoendopeptidase F [[Eubacterium] yurii subsp. margaretiae ATCC 43715]EJP24589.1 oligoendopeptidase F [Peptostreptococcaceae bacterium AS15]